MQNLIYLLILVCGREVRWYHGAAVVDSRLYAVGGCAGLASVEWIELEPGLGQSWQASDVIWGTKVYYSLTYSPGPRFPCPATCRAWRL